MFKNKKGFTIPEVLISIGILAISSLTIGYLVRQNSNIMKASKSEQYVPGVNSDILNKARSVLLSTKNETTGRRTQGTCSLLYPQQYTPGIYPVNLLVPTSSGKLSNGVSPNFYKKETWDAALDPEWKIIKFTLGDLGALAIEVVPKTNTSLMGADASIDLSSFKVVLSLSLRTVSNSASDLFSTLPAGTTQVDAKKVMFMIESNASYKRRTDNGSENQVNIAKDLISVVDIGACDVQSSTGTWLTLSPAGTGIGDPSGGTIYNNTVFSEQGVKAFEITFAATEVVQGRYINGRLSADRSKNVAAACAETRFQCKQKNNPIREFRSFINVTNNITYFSRNTYGYRESVRVNPSLVMLDSKGNDFIKKYNVAASYTNAGDLTYGYNTKDGLYYSHNSDGSLNLSSPLSFTHGQNKVTTTLRNVEGMCRSVCSVHNPQLIRPEMQISTPDFQVDGKWLNDSMAASSALHCTMCYMKSCNRMGYETFGPVNEFPDEPLDAQMPECLAEDSDEIKYSLPFASKQIERSVNSTCISGHFESGKLVLKTRSCDDQLPALCFAYGQYTLAREIGSTNPKRIKFQEAHQACRQLGHERQIVSELRDGIQQQGGDISKLALIPTEGSKYSFINLAKQGIFTSPQGEDYERKAAKEVTAVFGQTQAGQEFWIALRDAKFGVIAEAPSAYLGNDSSMQHAIYYNSVGIQTHSVVGGTPYDFIKRPSSARSVNLLVHNIKYKGLVLANDTQDRPFEFLCMKKSDKSYYITSGHASVEFGDGASACENSGGYFVAPQNSASWLASLLKVQANGNYLSFPELSSANKAVWVALEGADLRPAIDGAFSELGYKNPKAKKLAEGIVDRDGNFVEERQLQKQVRVEVEKQVPASNQYGNSSGSSTMTGGSGSSNGTVAMVTVTEYVYEWVQDTSIKYKHACFSERDSKITLRSEADGCSSGELRVTENDFKNPIVSLQWVLQKSQFNLGNKEYIKVN